jgi:hypothetical protein
MVKYVEIKETETKIKVERQTDDGKKGVIGYYDPTKTLIITSSKDLVEYLITEKGVKLVGFAVDKEDKFFFALIKA